ncbi:MULTISPECIES: UDP-N-acetylmuramoyl-L-alanyl-D-glutamate--2,6-diaminopimelate ligase [Sutcliffiella]|uniref:UDP-N-acetylmuramoyl-L-alanyl-D-glutamate--2,6-diaminopimelate ligase n=1 Tax=Sutcliffiella cohnii TaxID=33932 RepID=A0A223KRT6_9BACI|nr:MULTISPECIES: UDP-N-acetylmuramoyl-L-alanyl-D-glutamate--2,6-diaminopimelate ligase [Sutcliffiella]AST92146.1 UDP-N-acetylmuramoyl-L-alanyl-D-glutamate--2,6-diaminopimelate ligase [Sutcliffiella cohnii]MED4015432.1 UDP-N-acetylmuramoyl-L-alanyl-D-glutamate--2,6-diaminopimelate ligase [Sutcliffiella cohnii]WBL13378.1 UDP-N-acetylmuramoyl-L-alanyl-D-glutamate--2,6-diaminopimelate ligase [Sutcliffiella sp. NC1]
MNLNELVQHIHHYSISSENNPFITQLDNDSRTVKSGSLFFCIKGFTVDGHDYVQQAVANGAVAIIAEKPIKAEVPVVIVRDTNRALAIMADVFYGQPSHSLHVISVTGTNGKTTTSHYIDHIFRYHSKKTGMIGTIHIKIDDETYPVKNTTPDQLLLQQSLHKMKNKGVEMVVMEVSSHALDLGRVRGCDIDIAIFTNLSHDHLDYHHSMEEYRNAKGLLFSSLGNTYNIEKPKVAILNEDDTASEYYKKVSSAQILTYGIEKNSDFMAKNIRYTAEGTYFDLHYEGKISPVKLKLVGKFNVYNILAAITSCYVSKIPMETILKAIGTIKGVPGRFELVNEGQPFTVIVDYAHTPDSLENILKAAKQITTNRLICIVGCGGDRDRTKRPLMGRIAVERADWTIFTSDNPRTEKVEQIIADMESEVSNNKYEVIVDREKAIFHAMKSAQKGDCIIIAGKGHETYQVIGKEIISFDDRKVAKAAIKAKLRKQN